VRALIRCFDGFLREALGVCEFCEDPDCLLRLRFAGAPHVLRLGDRVVEADEPVLELHFWNEHFPPLPLKGSDLAWAVRTRGLLVRSLRGVAGEMGRDPRLAGVRAVGGVTVLLSPGDHPAGVHLMERLGFTVLPYHGPWGRFGEFWENFYTWWLMWTYNPVSVRLRSLLRLRRAEVWMPADEFLRRYGAQG